MILYKLSYPNELNHVRTLVKPQPFEYAGWFLRKIGAIPSTRIEEKKGGAVTRIVNELKETPQCLFLISPKGTIIKSEWRSGYFVIAKELDAELIAMGFDYEKKCVVASDAISHNKGESVVKEYLQTQLSNIVPLFPDDEIVPIREHVVAHRNVVSNKRLAIIFGLIALIGYYLW
jgi:1-acyl-sn-glycerol-3-phosphate acyltransferase